ncbi:MAG: hypothetical protein HY866_14550, partial [Chloroflexi bacterium]|nr:hypothetical protein [Chloroflexota bacterium]
MKLQSLRVRLILAYAGLIVLGFGGLALIAGQQISKAARDDYKLQLINEVTLVAQGVARAMRELQGGGITQAELNEIVANYESRTDATLTLLLIESSPAQSSDRDERDRQPPGGDQSWPLSKNLQSYPELVGASRDTITIDQREDDEGQDMIYTAAPMTDGPHLLGYVQLSEPASHLQQALYRRWSSLGLGVLVITGIALLASVWL